MIEAVQATVLVLVAAMGAGVALTRDPIHQAVAASFFGLLLATLFLALQAPDAALSEIVVGAVIVPLMILLALSKARDYAMRHERAEDPEEGPESKQEEEPRGEDEAAAAQGSS